MAEHLTQPVSALRGEISVPGDKSISHRFVMLASIADGVSEATHFLTGADCLSTVKAFQALGVDIDLEGTTCRVRGVGKHGLTQSQDVLDLGNSGTTMRLLTGLLSGQSFSSTLVGDESLSKRPMDRIIVPLREMGADLKGRGERMTPPLEINPRALTGIDFVEEIGSAQVKSAVLLAGLYAEGVTRVTETKPSRDHTERMLEMFGVVIEKSDNQLSLKGPSAELKAGELTQIPGDISSAAFFLVAASMVKGSEVTLKGVSLNETRTGVVDVLKRMGASLEISNVSSQVGEKFGDIQIKASSLKGVTITAEEIPRLIDELPILMVACSCAEGMSRIEDISELRVKETDRVESMVKGLTAMGANIEVDGNVMTITGVEVLNGGVEVSSFNDHRTAMSFIVAGLNSRGALKIDSVDSINISYPSFLEDLSKLTRAGSAA